MCGIKINRDFSDSFNFIHIIIPIYYDEAHASGFSNLLYYFEVFCPLYIVQRMELFEVNEHIFFVYPFVKDWLSISYTIYMALYSPCNNKTLKLFQYTFYNV